MRLPQWFEKVPLIEAGKINPRPYRTASGFFSSEFTASGNRPAIRFCADLLTIRPKSARPESGQEHSFYLDLDGLWAAGWTIEAKITPPESIEARAKQEEMANELRANSEKSRCRGKR